MAFVLNLSVHDIVDVLRRRGHLDNRVFNQSSMQEGTRLHALYQSEQGADYLSEYALSHVFEEGKYTFKVSGKADGVLLSPTGEITVEEIKTTVADLETFARDHADWHLSQAMFYAHILALDRNRKTIRIVLTYIQQNNYAKRKRIEKVYKADELETFVHGLLLEYAAYMDKILEMKEERDRTCKDLSFPFESYRKGQKRMMEYVEKAALEGRNVYIEAPTGIGKTISCLYPLLCLFGKKECDHVFYLTSKNSIKTIAMNAMKILVERKAKVKSLLITSKENICFNDRKGHCNPDECPFARNYYDKLLDNVFDILGRYDSLDRDRVVSFCLEKRICPFQFQLDLTRYVDVLIADYTYVYDYHDRLDLEDSSIARQKSFLLVDECHNLPERVRDMFSLELTVEEIEEGRKSAIGKELSNLRKDLKELLDAIEAIDYEKEDLQGSILPIAEIPDRILDAVRSFNDRFKSLIKKSPHLLNDGVYEIFYALNGFDYLATLLDENGTKGFQVYATVREDRIFSLKIACLDPTPFIQRGNEYFRSVLFFSATLSPKDYYIDLLGGDVEDRKDLLVMDSPFPKENRLVLLDTIPSLRYRDRDETIESVARLALAVIKARKGNYFVFCPSFEYLRKLSPYLEKDETIELHQQTPSMREEEREKFLSLFPEDGDTTRVGLLVLGGVFSEGIDLTGEKLIGAIVLSIGLPQIGYERDRIKDYYDRDGVKKGFDYAYSYPGFNRVLQAAGRVIRSEKDRGVLLFVDSRFKKESYQKAFEEIYPDMRRVFSPSAVYMACKKFWEEKK